MIAYPFLFHDLHRIFADMPKFLRVCRFAAVFLAALGLFGAARPAPAAVVDSIAATVNGRAITRTEVDRALARAGFSLFDPGARKQALNALIDKVLIEQEAARRRVGVADEELDRLIDTVVERSNSDLLTLRAEVEKRGLTWDEYREELRGEALRTRAFAMAMRNDPRWSGLDDEERLREFYLKNVHLFRTPTVVRLLHLPGTPDEREALEKVAARVAEGVSLPAAAGEILGREPSDTGEMTQDSLSDVFREALEKTPTGALAPLVEAAGGVHLLYVVERAPGRLPPFEEVKDRVVERFGREGQLELYGEWLDDLRANAVIERRD